MIAKVLINKNIVRDRAFDYLTDEKIDQYSLVEVPFGKNIETGIVLDIKKSSLKADKKIKRVLTSGSAFSKNQIELSQHVAKYYSSSFSHTANSFLPPLNKRDLKRIGSPLKNGPPKSKPTKGVCIVADFDSRITFFCQQLSISGQNIIILPTINKIIEVTKMAKKILPDANIVSWHSRLTSAQQASIWQKIISGENIIVIGTRHCAFLPFICLKSISIDDPTNFAYQEDQAPYYNAYTVARLLHKITPAKLSVGTDCPDLLTYSAIRRGLFELKEIGDSPPVERMPRWHKASENLEFIETLKNALDDNKKIVFIGPFKSQSRLICKTCQRSILCEKCHTDYFQSFENKNICTSCQKYAPEICQNCNGAKIAPLGITFREIIHNIKELLPDHSDKITTSPKAQPQKVIKVLTANELETLEEPADVVVFPYFRQMLNTPNFGNTLKIFKLIQSLRSHSTEKIIIFANSQEDDETIDQFTKNDWKTFLTTQLRQREKEMMPPFSRVIEFWQRGRDTNKIKDEIEKIIDKMNLNIIYQIDLETQEKDKVLIKKIIFVKHEGKNLFTKQGGKVKIRLDPVDFL